MSKYLLIQVPENYKIIVIHQGKKKLFFVLGIHANNMFDILAHTQSLPKVTLSLTVDNLVWQCNVCYL